MVLHHIQRNMNMVQFCLFLVWYQVNFTHIFQEYCEGKLWGVYCLSQSPVYVSYFSVPCSTVCTTYAISCYITEKCESSWCQLCCHFTGGTVGCHNDNLHCHKWWQSWPHENCQVSVNKSGYYKGTMAQHNVTYSNTALITECIRKMDDRSSNHCTFIKLDTHGNKFI